MPRYFFDIHDDVDVTDEVGLELPDLKAARSEVARALTEAALDALPSNGPSKAMTINVRDEGGRRVLQAVLSFTTDPEF